MARRWLNFLWPRMGLRRYLSYLRHRIGRMRGTPHSVAAGFASGAAMSMTPFMGFHFLLSALLAWVMRGNIIASAFGTVAGNPWTFPFIWLWSYRIGCWILDTETARNPFAGFSFSQVMDDPYDTLEPILVPMLVGSVPLGVTVWFLTYWPLRKALEQYRRQRIERRHMRALALMEERGAARHKEEQA